MTIHLEHHSDFPSNHVHARNVDVWLPPGYQSERPQQYGVLYMHDGQNLFQPELAYKGADHNEKSWRERVHVPLEFLPGYQFI